MNLALSALIILLLLLPSVFFRIGISIVSANRKTAVKNSADPKIAAKFSSETIRYNFIKVLSKLNFTETIFFFSIVPLLLNIISLYMLQEFGYKIDYALLLNIFSGAKDAIKEKDDLLFNIELLSFLKYAVTEIILAFLLGLGLIYILLKKPERILALLIGDNIWFRLFTGLMLLDEERNKTGAIMVQILCNTKETTVIYAGYLQKFDLVPHTNEISYITIKGASRIDLRSGLQIKKNPADANESVTSYLSGYGEITEIPGRFLTILGKEIININTTYFELTMTKDGKEVEKLQAIT